MARSNTTRGSAGISRGRCCQLSTRWRDYSRGHLARNVNIFGLGARGSTVCFHYTSDRYSAADIYPIYCRIRLKYDNSKLDASATMLQLAKMQERKNSLRRKIKAWIAVQHLYMPEVSVLRTRADRAASETSAEIAPWDFPLHLPSSLPPRTTCLPILRQHEFQLREAQAYEALDALRDHLRLRTHMYKYKNKNIIGQRANTRSQNLINSVQERANASATKYRTARTALENLSRHVDNETWRTRLLPLNQEDVRPLKEDGESEGRRTLSWIWKIVGVGGDSADEGLQEGTSDFMSAADIAN